MVITWSVFPKFRPPLVPNDEKVFSMMVEEMQQKGEIKQRKADIQAFNKVSGKLTLYSRYILHIVNVLSFFF